ncbi:TetR family transcriptional regulator [Rhodococcus hoagii]|nr:TetR family transcriptional regulator [Prescottella equi]NKS56503.1 TetR family transcriptional regulator [Prescottella equi]NKS64843.1 TetR family transcriptional regulator [Prescottella equi]NKS70091.1 TetR family transcriptional regulator [Prescottella equi]NKU56485.1 TetR family transcriptional regulator [Prescottella equi]
MQVFPEDRRRQRSATSRAAIVDAAQELLTQGGAESVQVETVAEMVDMSVQTIYNRVGKRSQLLLAVAERAMEECSQLLSGAFAAPGTASERATAVGTAYMRFAFEYPSQFQLLANPPDDAARSRIADLAGVEVARMAQVLTEGRRNGEFALPAQPTQVAVALWAMMDGVIALSWRTTQLQLSRSSLEEAADAAVHILLSGLQAGSPEQSLGA